MKLMICVDSLFGYAFNGRPQSRDREQKKHFEAFQAKSGGEWLIAGTKDLTIFRNEIDEIALYRWNRQYPADKWLNELWLNEDFELKSRERIPGYSHETITFEYYKRRKKNG